ncbi:MAG: protein kinase [Blastocatellia bacterium]|nr:protein kinase [Blastocatellia bacterium]
MAITTGTQFGQYAVTAPLGKGGMGEVYLAEDARLKRKVALKLLPAEFTQNSERLRRFEQEAQATSALNHPNIITIHEIGAHNGTHYIATEFIAGRTLRDHLRQPLPLDESLNIALQMANALAAAHDAGIIHRDIKPENVMVRSDGIVKVLDFGLAKLTERHGDVAMGRQGEEADTWLAESSRPPVAASHSTTPGTVMGTASYMSPEQARGEKVDARSDLFSLGIVLYEMIAGRQPFSGVNMLDVIGAILHQEPAPLPAQNEAASAELQRIVTKALHKDRAARYQTAQELAHDLKELKDELAYQARAALGTHAPRVPLASVSEANSLVSESAEVEATSLPAQRASVPSLAAREARAYPSSRRLLFSLLAVAAIALAVAAFFYFKRQPALTDKDTILLTDFENKTGDAVFDGTLKQALAVHLGQSPFLNLFADERVRETLRLMNRSPDERLTPAVGREICQRQGLKAMLTGTIASLGRNYVINLEAINGQTGDVLAREQTEAEGKEQVLRTLGEAATRLREKLGESLGSIQKYDAPLAQTTTSSLEALKAFSQALEQNRKGRFDEAVAAGKRTIELDPKFALAYSQLAINYINIGQQTLSEEAAQKAFALRERVSEREKLDITYRYYLLVTGELPKAIETLELIKQTYPRDDSPYFSLGNRYDSIGRFEKAVEEQRERLRLNPNEGNALVSLTATLIRLSRYAEAKATAEQAIALKFDTPGLRGSMYLNAFINGDTPAMQQQIDWANARPGEYAQLIWQARTAVFGGQWQKGREFSNRAAELADQRDLQEVVGEIVSSNAEWAANLGLCQKSRTELARIAALPHPPLSYLRAGIAMALCGTAAQANTLANEAVKRYPKDTQINEIYQPLIRAAIELQRGNRTQAIQLLEPARRYESVSFFYQNYLRGQAYLGERNGAAAVSEFQKILDHRGWSPASPLYPLAHLGLARAALLQGDTAKARKSYQAFFALWKDADADLPVLIAAKKEYEKLK